MAIAKNASKNIPRYGFAYLRSLFVVFFVNLIFEVSPLITLPRLSFVQAVVFCKANSTILFAAKEFCGGFSAKKLKPNQGEVPQ